MFNTTYKYDYPDGLNLHPESETHKKLLAAVKDRRNWGYAAGKTMRERSRKLDHLQNAYVPTDSDSIWELKKDSKAPVDVVIPMSRACLDTLVSYSGGEFLGDPSGMYSLAARGDKERLVSAAKMDRLLNTQAIWFKHALSHYTSLRDMYLYGLSAMVPTWSKHKRRQAVVDQVGEILYELLRGTVKTKPGDLIRFLEEVIVHEGSELVNVDVYSLIVDPNCTLNNYQKSEYLGYYERTNVPNLLQREGDPEERLFNCKYVKELAESGGARSSENWANNSGRFSGRDDISQDSPVMSESGFDTQLHEPHEKTTREVDVAHLYWHLIPSEWGLSDRDYPEWYEISVAGDNVIIRCQRIDYDHGHVPMLLAGPTTSGYEMFPISGMAATYGMQQFMDWKIRCHWWNASKVQNDQMIVDGSAIELDDLRHPRPGGLIRLKRPLFGNANIDQYIKQLNVVDVTGGYVNDVNAINDLMNRVLGTQDILSGNMSQMPDRPTATGMQAAMGGAGLRMKMYSHIITDQEWYDLIQIMAHNNVQFMEHPMAVSIVGSRFETQVRTELGLSAGTNTIDVDPWDLDMLFDLHPQNRIQKEMDGTTMNMMMERFLSIPEVAMSAFAGIDVRGMFLAMVREMGFANISAYVQETGNQMPPVNPMVLPDEQIAAGVDSGQYAPMGAMNG